MTVIILKVWDNNVSISCAGGGGGSYIGKCFIIYFVLILCKFIVFQKIANAADLKIATWISREIWSTHRYTGTTDSYYHYNYSALISGQVPAEGTPLDTHWWEGGAHAGRTAAAASFSRHRALDPAGTTRGSTKTQTLCEQDNGPAARFPIFPETFGHSDFFPAGEKWDFVCYWWSPRWWKCSELLLCLVSEV